MSESPDSKRIFKTPFPTPEAKQNINYPSPAPNGGSPVLRPGTASQSSASHPSGTLNTGAAQFTPPGVPNRQLPASNGTMQAPLFQSGVGYTQSPGSSPGYPSMPFPPSGPNQWPGNAGYQTSAPQNERKGLFGRKQKKRPPLSRRAKIILLVVLLILLFPTLITLLEGVNGYILYSQARSGLTHIQNAQNLFSGGTKGNLAKYFDINKLQQAQQEINAAHSNFQQVSNGLDQDSGIGMFANLAPKQINAARALAHVGVDATQIAQQFVVSAIKLSPSLVPALSNPLGNASGNATDNPGPPEKPYITPTALDEIYADLHSALPLIHDMNMRTQGISVSSLPLSANQSKLLTSVVKLLPTAEIALTQISGMKNEMSWLLGVDHLRTFLVEPMDRSELRATGGFTGQFGELAINGGHTGQLKLKNIGQYEEDHTDEGTPLDTVVFPKVAGQKAPDPYSQWWPVANFGLRDANVSADVPTSAKIIMDRYTYEFGTPLDGVITFTPFMIKNILQVTGAITIPEYNETITAQNLEDRLHYYQDSGAGIAKGKAIEHVSDNQLARKLFTGRLTKALMDKAQHLPVDQLQALVAEVFTSLKTKDLQIYINNPQVEALVAKYGSTGAIDRSTNHDGLLIVQDNLSASKASQYVSTTVDDTIALDVQGNATHTMQMTLDYQKKGDVFGMDTYRDYIRIYTPPTSQFVSGNGFAIQTQAAAYCSADSAFDGYIPCAKDVYHDGTLVCTANPTAGPATWLTDDPWQLMGLHPLTRLGPPENQTSDETGRNMVGGWAVIPPNCTLKITLSWTVPAANAGHPYNLLIQRQASVSPQINLTMQPAPGTCSGNKPADLHLTSVMSDLDRTFTLKQGASCSLQMQ